MNIAEQRGAEMSAGLGPQRSFRSSLVQGARRLCVKWAWRAEAAHTGNTGRTLSVALISGLCGIVLGVQTGLQIPVESAQVLAGAVQYPADNPFYIYHVKAWTILHQVSGLLLGAGLSDRAASLLLGGLAGMVSCQALAMCALAIGRQWLVALLVPILCLGTKLFEDLAGVYDIALLSDRTWKYYGTLATALVVLAWALYGLGLRRTSAFLMGLAPACHPALGGWCLGIGVLCIAWSWRQERSFLRGTLLWMLLGLAISAGSFTYHLHQVRGLPTIAPELRDEFVTSFALHWDRHRQAVPLSETVVAFGLCVLVAGVLWLVFQSRRTAPSVTFLMRSLVISAALGLLLVLATHLGDRLPTLVMMAMPGRYINVVALAFPAVVLGLLARLRLHPAFHALTAVVVAYLTLWQFRSDLPVYVPELHHAFWMATAAICYGLALCAATDGKLGPLARCLCWGATGFLVFSATSVVANDRYVAAAYLLALALLHFPSAVRRMIDRDEARRLAAALIAVCGACAAVDVVGWQLTLGIALGLLAVWLVGNGPSPQPSPQREEGVRNRISPSLALASRRDAATWLAAAASLVLIAVSLGLGVQRGYDFGIDYRNDPLLSRVHQGTGMVLSGPGVRGLQLRARRPVLLEVSALNQVLYVPESGPAMNHILRRIYDEDVLRPRPAGWVIERGGLMRTSARDVWQARTAKEWRLLAKEFGFTQIVVRDDWHLQLPFVISSSQRKLYEVPSEDVPSEDAPLEGIANQGRMSSSEQQLPVTPAAHHRTRDHDELD
jgi:hypothetical protein